MSASNRIGENPPSGMIVEPGGDVTRLVDPTLVGAPPGYPTFTAEGWICTHTKAGRTINIKPGRHDYRTEPRSITPGQCAALDRFGARLHSLVGNL